MVGVKSDNIPKDGPIENLGPMNISKSIENIKEKIEDLNLSYGDASLDGRGLSSFLQEWSKFREEDGM